MKVAGADMPTPFQDCWVNCRPPQKLPVLMDQLPLPTKHQPVRPR